MIYIINIELLHGEIVFEIFNSNLDPTFVKKSPKLSDAVRDKSPL